MVPAYVFTDRDRDRRVGRYVSHEGEREREREREGEEKEREREIEAKCCEDPKPDSRTAFSKRL